jgi:molybdopterin-guanine dinucleotide biosynthesis adapter protein
MRRLHIVGRKNSGKTTLIVDLVQYFTSAGFRIGTIKHTHHRHELDTPGKDSHRHREAGAQVVGILSQGLSAVFLPVATQLDRTDRYTALAPSFADCDLVLVEGDSATNATKIEVWRAATETGPLAQSDSSILALITDDAIHAPVPLWPRADIPRVADGILRLCGVARPGTPH